MFNPTVDKPDIVTGGIEFILGIIFFPLVFYSIICFLKNSILGRLFCNHFKIKNNGILDIGNKLTSSTFAFLACLTGITVARQCNGNSLYERYHVLDNYLIFGFSYFFYDIVSMYMVFSTERKDEVTFSSREVITFFTAKPMIILHHVLVPLVGFPVLMHFRGGTGDCLLGTSFLIEASTPFVSLRVILVHLNMKNTTVYVINGLLMLVSFFFCRVMLFPYLYCWYASALGQSIFSTLFSLPTWVHLVVFGLWAPQLIWFQRMLKGSIKLIRENRRRHRERLQCQTRNEDGMENIREMECREDITEHVKEMECQEEREVDKFKEKEEEVIPEEERKDSGLSLTEAEVTSKELGAKKDN